MKRLASCPPEYLLDDDDDLVMSMPPQTTIWETCPTEMLCKIFSYVDEKSLLNCLAVSKRWYSIAMVIARSIGWKNVIVNGIPDKGDNYLKKTEMNWQEAVVSYSFWQNVNLANLRCYNKYELKNIIKINVYRDSVIVVCPENVKYYDLKSFNLKKTLELSECGNFDENDYFMVATSKNSSLLTICKKTCPGSEWEPSHTTQFNCNIFRLAHAGCYIVAFSHRLFYVTWSKEVGWTNKGLARYYGHGSICDLTVYYDDVYVLLDWGRIMKVDKEGLLFELQFTYDIPRSKVYMFNIVGVVVAAASGLPMTYRRHGPNNWVLICKQLSTVLVHGQLLFLGYETGEVRIFIPANTREIPPKPEIQFNVQKFVSPALENPAIVSMEVSESRAHQELLVATSSALLRIKLEFPLWLKSFMLNTAGLEWQ